MSLTIGKLCERGAGKIVEKQILDAIDGRFERRLLTLLPKTSTRIEPVSKQITTNQHW